MIVKRSKRNPSVSRETHAAAATATAAAAALFFVAALLCFVALTLQSRAPRERVGCFERSSSRATTRTAMDSNLRCCPWMYSLLPDETTRRRLRPTRQRGNASAQFLPSLRTSRRCLLPYLRWWSSVLRLGPHPWSLIANPHNPWRAKRWRAGEDRGLC